MSDALLGVVIGGIIASIAPIAILITEHRRWKRESKLEYLRSERNRSEALYSKTLDELAKAMAANSYPSRMTSDIFVLMPKSIGKRFEAWIDEKDKDELKSKHAYMEICVEMKNSLAEIDDRIRAVIDA